MSKGAGGSNGGIGSFFIGLVMMCGGFYLLLNAISVTSSFGMSQRLFGFSAMGSQMNITSGMVMLPFIFGVGMIFYNAKGKTGYIGWFLAIGSVSAMLFGVISSVNFHMRTMTAFDLITILVLAVGGLGLFLRSLRNFED
jgi:hypothetical protein